MLEPVRFENVTRKFESVTALSSLSFSIAPSRIVGLIGRNSSGKTTLLRHIVGLYLPTSGECLTFGKRAGELGDAELSRIGLVSQRDEFLTWMRVKELLSYVGAFYSKWDSKMASQLLERFELDEWAKIDTLSPGKKQRLAILLATCHHPELILLDEPLSDLDPLARESILKTLLDIFRGDGPTILISSHMLHDIERIIDHVICIEQGRMLLDESLDAIHERFAEWTVTTTNGSLPQTFSEPWILSQSGVGPRRHLVVTDSEKQLAQFGTRHGVTVETKPMNLERVFTTLVGTREGAAGAGHERLADK